jgi:S-DNA-T family DNA segregation ATPase FtsK/SpoIIIE
MGFLDGFKIIKNQFTVNKAINDVLVACWPNAKRPQLHHSKRTNYGYEFCFGLQPGISFRDFCGKEEYFRDAIGNVTTEMIHTGKTATLKIITNQLAGKYEYDWNYDKRGILPFPVGYSHSGLITADLARVYTLLIGGYVGSGKSNSIHVIVNSLLSLEQPPRIVIADFKLLEYNYLKNYVLLVTEPKTAHEALSRLVSKMRRRLQLLADCKCVNIQTYNKKTNNSMDYIVLVIDELAELTREDSQEHLETLLRLCRATGIHIILATQRPSSTIFGSKKFGDSKANLIGRLAFQCADTVNSKIILDSGEAATLPNTRPCDLETR